MKRPDLILAAGFALVMLSGCATQKPQPAFQGDPLSATAPSKAAPPLEAAVVAAAPEAPKLDPALLQPPTDLFVLGPGDQVDIDIPGNANSHASPTVGLDGKIYYSFLPGIDVWGLTLDQARARIEAEMGKYVTQSRVSLTLKAVGSKYIWLLGRVSKPGIYPLSGTMTLLEALAMAGGTATTASSLTTEDIGDLRHSFVMREGRVLPVDFTRLLQQGDMSQNIYLRPDDFVFIPSSLSQQVYVLGAVAAPRSVPYTDGMTLLAAISGAGGPVKDAYTSHVGIARGSISNPRLIEANFDKISGGSLRDIPVEPGDIIYVPLTPYHVLTDYLDLIVGTFARSWSANMGSRAVNGSSTLGVAVPVGGAH